MLVLTRTREEEIVVTLPDGREVVIRVLDVIHGNKVSLGFTADEDIGIYRRELLTALQAAKKASEIRDPLGVAEAYNEGAPANV